MDIEHCLGASFHSAASYMQNIIAIWTSSSRRSFMLMTLSSNYLPKAILRPLVI